MLDLGARGPGAQEEQSLGAESLEPKRGVNPELGARRPRAQSRTEPGSGGPDLK